MWKRLLHLVFVRPWKEADRMPPDMHVGPWDATAKAVFTLVSGTLLLCGMNFVVLDGGRVVGVGTHSDLLERCPTYTEIVSSQLTAEEAA